MSEFKVEIHGFKTKEQADDFVGWWQGIGEQSLENWGDHFFSVMHKRDFWDGNTKVMICNINDVENEDSEREI